MSRDSGSGGGARGHVNEMGGTAFGSVLQARDVFGDVHVHDGATPLPIPRQLPRTGILVNRDEALAALDRTVSAHGLVVVTGQAGIGKTAVALHWASGRLRDFPDGQLYADLHGHAAGEPAPPAEVLGRFIRAFGIPGERVPAGLAERAGLFRSLVAGRRLLVVLDDAYSAAQVAPLLPGGPGGVAVVVTSRWRLAGLMMRGASVVRLGPLAEGAALELLGRALGSERIGLDREKAGELVELCARSPLALSVAAARLVTRPGWSLDDLVRDLGDEKRRLVALAVPDAGDEMTIRAALEMSYRGLPGRAQRLYRMLGLFPGPAFDARMAAALAGEPLPEARDRLGVLDDANLLEHLPGGRYRLHQLARLHALDTAHEHDSAGVRAEAIRRLVEWTVATALAASDAAAPYRGLPEPPDAPPGPPEFADAAGALDWLEQEFPTVRAVAARARESGLDREAFLLVDAVWPLFLHRGQHAERLDFDRVGLAAARALDDRYAEAKMLNRTGLALRALGRPAEAAGDFREALGLWRRLGERARAAGTRRRLGMLEFDRGDMAAAAAEFSAALDEYRAARDDRRAALTLCDLGAAHIRDGRSDQAVQALSEAEGLLSGTGDDAYNQARVLVLLGQAHASRAEPSTARALVTRGLAEMRQLGSAVGAADALHVLGDLALQEDRTAEARECYEEARGILAGAGAPTRILDRRLAELGEP